MSLVDPVGTRYTPPGPPTNTPPPSGTQVTIHGPNGPAPGTMIGGVIQPNKY